ncbi:AAA family ATPase [Candidatus Poriferisodalis sp.]|uniref:AAA family ATPase n=1 Tax=Candidatus Poriferisodalis sp. TaxID=3101277 RepID=UPI003B017862
MRVHRITLHNFAGVDSVEVVFDTSGVTVIEGDNEAGKTTIVTALDLLLDRKVRDRSGKQDVKAIRPVHYDADPEVEAEISTGPYRFVFSKRWGRTSSKNATALKVTAPSQEQLTGDEAHDRAYEILDETLDASLLRALQVHQGTELLLPTFQDTELGAALDVAAGSAAGGDRHGDLWTAIEVEYSDYWTPTGREKSSVAESRHRLEEAEAKVAMLEEQLRGIESDAKTAAQLSDNEPRLVEATNDSAKTRDKCRRQVETAETLEDDLKARQRELDDADRDYGRALVDQTRREELVDDLRGQEDELAEMTAKTEQSAPALAAAQSRNKDAEDAWRSAQEQLGEAQQASELADRDREHLRQIIEAQQFSDRHQRLLAAQQQFDQADDIIDAIDLSDEDVSQIEAAERTLIQAQAAAQAGSATVTSTALNDVTLVLDGKAAQVAQGDEQVFHVADSIEIAVPEVLRLTIAAGVEARQLAGDVAEATAELRRLCKQAGVSDLTEARVTHQRRVDAERERREAHLAIERDRADLTVDEIAKRAKRLAARVAAYETERVAQAPLPPDEKSATRAALDLQDELKERRSEFEDAESARDRAQAALHTEEKNHAVLDASISAAERATVAARQKLESARAQTSDHELDERVASTSATAHHAGRVRDSALSRLEAADVTSLRSRLSNAEAVVKRAEKQLADNRSQLRDLLISLELRGEHGLETQLWNARGDQDRLAAEHRSLEARAAAAKLLHNVFKRRRVEAQQRYRAPFKRHIEQFGSIVYGSSFKVDIGDDLGIERRTLEGVTLGVSQLSTGAREQLGIIARLACAAIVSPDGGGAPVVLDDALGWSDPSRLQGMGAVINTAGDDCQVIILTCTPGRYAHVGNAKVVQLRAAMNSER